MTAVLVYRPIYTCSGIQGGEELTGGVPLQFIANYMYMKREPYESDPVMLMRFGLFGQTD